MANSKLNLTKEQQHYLDTFTLDLDKEAHNADWTKQTLDFPVHDVKELLLYLEENDIDLIEFLRSPAFQNALRNQPWLKEIEFLLSIADIEESPNHKLRYCLGKSPDGLPEVYIYSQDMKYRYVFARWWGGKGSFDLWIALNPSKSDKKEQQQDRSSKWRRTLARMIKVTQDKDAQDKPRNGIVIVNLFAYRDTDPKKIREVSDPVGPVNDAVLEALIKVSGRTIVAWGAQRTKLGRKRAAQVAQMMVDNRIEPRCLGICQGKTDKGHPRHPSRLLRDTKLESWSAHDVVTSHKG